MNIKNITKLLKAYFYENWQNDLIFGFVIVMAISLFSMLISPFDAGVGNIVAVILMIYYPCRLFSKLHDSSSRMHYLMIPASNAEKVVTGMFLANIYYVLGVMLFLSIGILLGYGINKIFNPDIEATPNLFKYVFFSSSLSILEFYTWIAFTFFAAIYFRKSPFWKLLLTGFLILIVFITVMAATVWLNAQSVLPAGSLYRNYIKTESYVLTGSDWLPYVFCCIAIVYCYAMSFLRMKETEV